MYKVFSFTNTDEAAPYMDKKILRYIDEQITDSFECFKDCDILAFDWYDVQSEKKEDFKMLLYLDGKDLLVFCETSEAEEKANMILHTMTGEEGATNERLFYHFFSLLLKGDMDFLNNLEEEISNNEDKVLSGDKASYLKYITAWRQELLRLKRYYEQLNFIFDEMTVNDNQLFSEDGVRRLMTLRNRTDRYLSAVKNLQEMVSQLREAYQSQLAIEQNDLMKIFTVVTVIFLPLSLLAGWYGMNFSHIPELKWKYGYPLVIASLGYALFGVGVEIAGITVSKIIVKWFKGKEMALAMGLEMACARIGTGLAIGVTPLLSRAFGNSISMPIFIGLILLCIGLLSFIVFVIMDKKRDAEDAAGATGEEEAEEPFRFGDILDIITLKGFWYMALLCVLFYSAVFPFLKYAPNLMINKFDIDPEWSGVIPALLPFGNILLTPFFGNLYDRKGKGATIMIIGSIMLIFIHFTFSIPMLDNWLVALILILLLGIAFSLVPSAMWPSVPKIIPENKLGTAYALIFWVQNWGLMGVPYIIGIVLDQYCISGEINGKPTYDYTIPMLIFTGFGVLALVISLLLKREDRIKGYGLELPNIQKDADKVLAEEMIGEGQR